MEESKFKKIFKTKTFRNWWKNHNQTNEENIKYSYLYDNFNKAFSLTLQNFNEITTNKDFQMKIENLEETIEKFQTKPKIYKGIIKSAL